jgi:hypothetical protein
MMAMLASKVLGTVRSPDGRAKGDIDGLVVRESGLLVVITKDDAWRLASQGLLHATIPGSATVAFIEAVGEAGPDAQLRLPDDKGGDDLVYLPIWDRERACWVNPLRPDGPPLPGPSLGL